ncbi:hypothetical protein [Amycolatopsis speibonae]|uniref:Uncharacterized protein n=1 Tax=Amycolatopsis speibonae TaxID=1450224 RepID=A0ABV7P8K6_9PSEU
MTVEEIERAKELTRRVADGGLRTARLMEDRALVMEELGEGWRSR